MSMYFQLLLSYLYGPTHKQIAFVLNTILALFICLTLIDGLRLATLTKTTTISVPVANIVILPNLGEWHLFGTFQGSLDTGALPNTSLQLTLVGTFAATQQNQGRAVIILPDGTQHLFSVGDVITDGAILQQVLPDKVILKHNGTLEKLTLPQRKIHFNKPVTPLDVDQNFK